MAEPITGELLDLFPDVVGWERAKRNVDGSVNEDRYGVRQYEAPVSLQARVTGRVQIVRGADGQETVSSVQATFPGAFGTSTEDRYTLPARFVPRVGQALSVMHATDENGPHHERVYFK